MLKKIETRLVHFFQDKEVGISKKNKKVKKKENTLSTKKATKKKKTVGPGVPPSEGKGILETLLSLREGRTISSRLSIG